MFRERDQSGPEENFLSIFRESIQESCVSNYIIVEDREALRTGKLLITFVDNCGRIVRQGRDDMGGAEHIGDLWFKDSWGDCVEPWVDGELGTDYKNGGACFYLLHI